MSEVQKKSLNVSKVPVHVYSSDKKQFGVVETFKSISREFSGAHALGLSFAARSIKTKYRQSLLGIFWALLPPLATAFIWIILNKSKVINMGDVGAPYPLFVITGTMIWLVFANSVFVPLQVVQANRSILVKINFPRESLIINAFYEILFHTLISFVIILICVLVFKVDFGFRTLLFFPAIFIMMIMGMSLGLLFLPFSLLYKDIQFALPTFLQFAMYLCPVVYAQPVFNGAGKILKLNPVSPVLANARSWLLGLDTIFPLWQLAAIASVSVVLFLVGIFLQRITMQTLIERMGT